MPSEVLNYFLKNSNWKVRLGFQLALQCAPFLKGLKVSCVISVDAYLYRGLGEMFRGLEVDYRMLSCSQGKCLVLFYRPDELERHLREQRLHSLIREYGYENMSLQEMIERLSDRVKDAVQSGREFPHEIGAFLGYPPEDVKGFIENEGEKYLMIGYWKVYSDLTHARMVFKEYDRAKNCAVNEFLLGKSIREIAV